MESPLLKNKSKQKATFGNIYYCFYETHLDKQSVQKHSAAVSLSKSAVVLFSLARVTQLLVGTSNFKNSIQAMTSGFANLLLFLEAFWSNKELYLKQY